MQPDLGVGADSIRRCESVECVLAFPSSHKFGRSVVLEAQSWAVVEFISDLPELVVVPNAEVRYFGKYWRTSPVAFSLLPRCHGECGSAK